MTPIKGEYRYGGDCVYVGIGTYGKVTIRLQRSHRKGAAVIPITRVKLIDVKLLSNGYHYPTVGWRDAHDAAYAEAEKRGWK